MVSELEWIDQFCRRKLTLSGLHYFANTRAEQVIPTGDFGSAEN